MSARDTRKIASIARRTFDRAGHLPFRERSHRAPLTAPRRAERRGTPAWSSRSLAERRPLRRLRCSQGRW
ncbi:hypothetical protein BH24CHL1_BH24CHL1_02370 [soil metagenome]